MMTILTTRLLPLACLLWLSSSQAASFDCAKAQTRVEKAICKEAALGRLDEAIAQEYRGLMGKLDPRFQTPLRDSQQVWLKKRPADEDLQRVMRRRLDDLKEALATTNGVALLSIDGEHMPPYVLTPLPGAAAYNAGVDAIWKVARRDADAVPEMNECSRLVETGADAGKDPKVVKKLDACTSLTSRSRYYKVDFVSPDLLSVEENLMESMWREAHPSNSSRHLNHWLSKRGKIEPRDIFASDGYHRVLLQGAQRFVAKAGDGQRYAPEPGHDDAQNPERWGLHADHLKITGQGYDYGIGRGDVEIEIPWRDFGATVRPQFLALLK